MSSERRAFDRTPQPRRDDGDDIVEGAPRRSTVIISIGLAVILLMSVVALFAYRALMGREPAYVAVVQGSEQWLGAHLTVSGDALPKPHTAVIDRTDRYSVPFFLPSGEYILVVRRDGVEAFRQQFELKATRTLEIPLPNVSAVSKAAHEADMRP